MKNKSLATQVVTMALLIALAIILTRFLSITLPIVRIGFGFIPIAVMGILYGPLWAGVGAALADILGMLIFPTGGSYFPGFTVTALLTGVVYGLIFYKKEITWKRTVIAVLTITVFLSLGLNTLWLQMLIGKSFLVLLPPRLVQAAIMAPVKILVIQLVLKRIIPRLPMGKQRMTT